MPKCLTLFLAGLSSNQAQDLWKWLDGYPNAVGDMITMLVTYHSEEVLKQGLCSSVERD